MSKAENNKKSLIDGDELKGYIDLFENSDLASLSIESGNVSIEMKAFGGTPLMYTQPMAAPMQGVAPSGGEPSVVSSGKKEVKSPITGTYYAAASPTSSPFISIGSTVSVGDVVCIVESMKVMNQIKSTQAGTVVKMLVKNGEMVSKDSVLVHLE